MVQPAGSEPGPALKRQEHAVELALATLLRVGVLLAAAFVLAGGVAYLFTHGGERPDYTHFDSETADLRSITGVANAAAHLQPRGLIQFGLLLLIATPIIRVAFSLLAFVRERDRIYVAITSVVLVILLLSLLGILP
jgi:uncharacterized membrane protein